MTEKKKDQAQGSPAGAKAEKAEAKPEKAAGGEMEKALANALSALAEAEKKAKEASDKAEALTAKLALADKQYVRLQADFDNFRRRTRNGEAAAKEKMTADVVKEFLPVLDNFDRALAHMSKDPAGAAYAEGFAMLQKQMQKVLADFGVTEIHAEGAHFDPHFHEAVMQAAADDKEDDTVSMVFQKGYMLKDYVIRPAKVQVVHNG